MHCKKRAKGRPWGKLKVHNFSAFLLQNPQPKRVYQNYHQTLFDHSIAWHEPILNCLVKALVHFKMTEVRSKNHSTSDGFKKLRKVQFTKPIANKIILSSIYEHMYTILKKGRNAYFKISHPINKQRCINRWTAWDKFQVSHSQSLPYILLI